MLAILVARYYIPCHSVGGFWDRTRYVGPGVAIISRGKDVTIALGNIYARPICRESGRTIREGILNTNISRYSCFKLFIIMF